MADGFFAGFGTCLCDGARARFDQGSNRFDQWRGTDIGMYTPNPLLSLHDWLRFPIVPTGAGARRLARPRLAPLGVAQFYFRAIGFISIVILGFILIVMRAGDGTVDARAG